MARIGIAVPNLPGITPPLIPEFARRIESGGFEAVWSLDRLAYENPDPLTALAACAAVTSRVRHAEQAKREAMTTLTRYYGPQFTTWYNPDKALVFGPPEECARRAQAYLDAGAQHLILVPTTLDVAQVDRTAREIVPRLRLDRR